MSIKAVVLDLDGTLLNSSKTITERSIRAVEAVRARGVEIIFATARPPRAVAFDNIDLLQFGSMVYYNGALYECGPTGQSYHHAIHREQAERVIDFLLAQGTEAEFSIEVQNRWFCARTPDYTRLKGFKELPAVIALQELKAYDCTKILIADYRETEALITKFGYCRRNHGDE